MLYIYVLGYEVVPILSGEYVGVVCNINLPALQYSLLTTPFESREYSSGVKTYVANKISCLDILCGIQVDFGHMEALNLITSPGYSEKTVGCVPLPPSTSAPLFSIHSPYTCRRRQILSPCEYIDLRP